MKEGASSAVYCEKVRLLLQRNYKQLQLNFITINELSLVFYGYGISEG